MKVSHKLLVAAVAGTYLVGQGTIGTGVYAADAPTGAVDDVPGTFVIDRINPEWNSVTVTWTDTGEDIDVPTRLVLAFVKAGQEMQDDWTKITYPYYMSQTYDRYYTDPSAASLVSGVTEKIEDRQMNGVSLNNNTKSMLWYGLETMVEGNPNELRYVMGVADYKKCMSVYTSGVECVREENEYGVMVYQPYMNGVKVNVEWEKPETPSTPSEPSDPDPEPSDPDDPEPNGPDDPNKNDDPDNPNKNDDPDDNGGDNSSNNNESVDNNDNGGNTGGETSSGTGGDDHWAGSSDPGNAYDWTGESEQQVYSYDYGYNYGYGGEVAFVNGGEDEMLAEVSDANEANTNSTTDDKNSDAASKNSTVAEYAEVPNLGGGDAEGKNGSWFAWALIPVLAGGIGLFVWWLWPIFAKKSKKEQKN